MKTISGATGKTGYRRSTNRIKHNSLILKQPQTKEIMHARWTFCVKPKPIILIKFSSNPFVAILISAEVSIYIPDEKVSKLISEDKKVPFWLFFEINFSKIRTKICNSVQISIHSGMKDWLRPISQYITQK